MFTTTKPTLTFQELRAVPVTAPADPGKLWQGVSHGDLMTHLLAEAVDRGIERDVKESRYWVSPDGGEMAAAVCVPGGTAAAVPYLGVVASTTQRRVLTVFSGTVDPATRAATVPAVMSRSKDPKWMYTTHFDPDYVAAKVWKWWAAAQKEYKDVNRILAAAEVSNPLRDRLLMAVGRKGILPWSRIGVADRTVAHHARAGKATTLRAVQTAVAVPLTMANPVDQLFFNHRLTALLLAAAKKKELT